MKYYFCIATTGNVTLIDGIYSVYKLVNLGNRVALISHIRRRWSRQRPVEGGDCRSDLTWLPKNYNVMFAYRHSNIIIGVNTLCNMAFK
jgi:hypothetical protein